VVVSQSPLPSHAPEVAVPPEQAAASQTAPLAYCAQAPLPLQRPVSPQLATP
jgi:hypothetical protein